MDPEHWLGYQEQAPDPPSTSDMTVAPHMPAQSNDTSGTEQLAPDLATKDLDALCAAFLGDPEIVRLLAEQEGLLAASEGDEGEASTTGTTPSLDAATPTTQDASVGTPSDSSYGAQEQGSDFNAYTEMHQLGLPGPRDLVGFGGPPQGYDYAAPVPAGRTRSGPPRAQGRKRGRESDGTVDRNMRPRLDSGEAGPSSHAHGLEAIPGPAQHSGIGFVFDPADMHVGPQRLWQLVHGGDARAVDPAHFAVNAGDMQDAIPRAPTQYENVQHGPPAGEWLGASPLGDMQSGPPRADAGRIEKPEPSEYTQGGSPVPNDARTRRGRKRTQTTQRREQDLTAAEGSNSQTESTGPGKRARSRIQTRQGCETDVSDAEADLGHDAQANNKQKSRPSRAIETYARSKERRCESIRAALAMLHQPSNAPLPAARPDSVNEAAIVKIKEYLAAQTEGARTGRGTWVDCQRCRDEYGVHERVLAHRLTKHENDSHELGFCVVCGCPITRGGIVQFVRHRKSNCAPWRVLVKIDRYLEWLETAGMIFPDAHKQFFADGVETRAPTHQQRVDELRAGDDVVDVQTMLARGRIFAGMVKKEIEEQLVQR